MVEPQLQIVSTTNPVSDGLTKNKVAMKICFNH